MCSHDPIFKSDCVNSSVRVLFHLHVSVSEAQCDTLIGLKKNRTFRITFVIFTPNFSYSALQRKQSGNYAFNSMFKMYLS